MATVTEAEERKTRLVGVSRVLRMACNGIDSRMTV
jgi:hypothetical protein